MFELNYKRNKSMMKFGLTFLIAGLLFSIVFLAVYITLANKKNSLDRQTNATRIEANGHYDDDSYLYSPIYYYTVNGIEYTCRSDGSSSTVPSSSGIVYYSSKNPKKCMTDYSARGNKFLLIGVAGGLLFVGVGFFIFKNPAKELKQMKYLAKNGKLIKGLPYQLEGTNTYVNGNQQMRIIAYYTLPNGMAKEFKSYPRVVYETYNVVDLLIDPNNPDNYYIDFDIKYSGDVQVEVVNSNVEKQLSNTVSPALEQLSQEMAQEENNQVFQNVEPQNQVIEVPQEQTVPGVENNIATNIVQQQVVAAQPQPEVVKQVIELPQEQTAPVMENTTVTNNNQQQILDDLPLVPKQAIANPNYQQNIDNLNNQG